VHTYEVAPVLTMMEHKCVEKVADLVGYAPEAREGIMAPGGSSANIYAVHAARHAKLGAAGLKLGVAAAAGGRALVAFVSGESHYSYKKAMNLLGLGTDNLVAVDTDPSGAMLPDALDAAAAAAAARGALPFFVGATSGTTVLGAFDPLGAVADVAERHGMWLHADAAWGGACLWSARERHRLDGVERCDSFTVNPHKMLGAPHQCSVFVTRRVGVLRASNASSADALGQRSSDGKAGPRRLRRVLGQSR